MPFLVQTVVNRCDTGTMQLAMSCWAQHLHRTSTDLYAESSKVFDELTLTEHAIFPCMVHGRLGYRHPAGRQEQEVAG